MVEPGQAPWPPYLVAMWDELDQAGMWDELDQAGIFKVVGFVTTFSRLVTLFKLESGTSWTKVSCRFQVVHRL